MKKEYKLKTIDDILGVVNEENLQNFIVDFSGWLAFIIGMEKIKDPNVRVELPNRGTFNWIDDGKNDVDIKIQIKNESLAPKEQGK